MGSYTPTVRYGNTTIGQGSPIVVTADTTTTADIDLKSTAGEVVGHPRVLGRSSPDPLSTSLRAGLCHPGDDGAKFAILLSPGTYTANVYVPVLVPAS